LKAELQSRDFDFLTLIHLLKRNKGLAFLCSFTTFLIAFVFTLTFKSGWEASTKIKIAQISMGENLILIESASTAASHISEEKFIKNVLKNINDESSKLIFKDYYKNLSVSPTRDVDIIEIKIQSTSEKIGILLIQENVKELQQIHEELKKPYVDNIRKQIITINDSITRNQREIENLSKSKARTDNALLIHFLRNETSELELKKITAEQKLNPLFNTRRIEGISTRPIKNTTKKISVSLIGVISGLALGCILAYFREYGCAKSA